MGVYWSVKSYNADSSYITGEIKSRGHYEFNMSLARPFLTGREVHFRHGVEFFDKVLHTKFIFDEFGLSSEQELYFYYDSDDLIDGTNVQILGDGIILGMLTKPDKLLNVLQQLADHTNNFDKCEEHKELLELLELLKEAKQNNQLVHCFWCE